MELWDRLTGRNVEALRAEIVRLEAHLAVARTALTDAHQRHDNLVLAVLDLQREVTEATDGQVEFLPRTVTSETTLTREHNRKQFHAVV